MIFGSKWQKRNECFDVEGYLKISDTINRLFEDLTLTEALKK